MTFADLGENRCVGFLIQHSNKDRVDHCLYSTSKLAHGDVFSWIR